MSTNSDEPRTPARWRIEITWKPTQAGIEGLNEIAEPLQKWLRFLDRHGDRRIVVRFAAISEWPDDGLDELVEDA